MRWFIGYSNNPWRGSNQDSCEGGQSCRGRRNSKPKIRRQWPQRASLMALSDVPTQEEPPFNLSSAPIGGMASRTARPIGTKVKMRLLHNFHIRDGMIAKEIGYEIWRRDE